MRDFASFRTALRKWILIGIASLLALTVALGTVAWFGARSLGGDVVAPVLEKSSREASARAGRFCDEASALKSATFFPQPEGNEDAAPFLNTKLGWAVEARGPDGKWVSSRVHGKWEVPESVWAGLSADAGALPFDDVEGLEQVDTSWMTSLRRFDRWSFAPDAPPVAPNTEVEHLPQPWFPELVRLARVHLWKGAAQGRYAEAAGDAAHLARLAWATETVLGAQTAVAILNQLRRLEEQVPTLKRASTPSREQMKALARGALWATLLALAVADDATYAAASACGGQWRCIAAGESATVHAALVEHLPQPWSDRAARRLQQAEASGCRLDNSRWMRQFPGATLTDGSLGDAVWSEPRAAQALHRAWLQLHSLAEQTDGNRFLE